MLVSMVMVTMGTMMVTLGMLVVMVVVIKGQYDNDEGDSDDAWL